MVRASGQMVRRRRPMRVRESASWSPQLGAAANEANIAK